MSRAQVAQTVARLWVEQPKNRAHLLQLMAAYLVETKTVSSADLLVRDIKKAFADQQSIVVADVASAFELNDSVIDQLKTVIKQETGAKRVDIVNQVDASLLGGVVIDTPEVFYDGSIRGKLNAMKGLV